ncbi:MAG: hypothetical protein K2X82_32005 [Gemmataceae bacterium]|nr:hypothetical protein [Gemmataceae bacterium]
MSGLRLAYYGDDFSGSADVMEVLAQAGVPTRLYLDPPAEVEPGLGAVGVAGVSRSLPTDELDGVLRPVFGRLKALGPRLVHYKVCSTFDSSPAVGSIGRAIDIGAEVVGGPCVPLVVGAPALGRYVAFGNLFARSGQDSPVYRLDRHPTMSRHPVTPMHEADLRLVLSEQTDRPVEWVDGAVLDSGRTPSVSAGVATPALTLGVRPEGTPIVLFDTAGEHHLAPVGRAVWDVANQSGPVFAAGSSGLEYALAAHWREAGALPPPPAFAAGPAERIVVVSGSCSPVTARQIERATANGFAPVAVPPGGWMGDRPDGVGDVLAETFAHLDAGRSVIVHAALGPDDPRAAVVRRAGVTDTGPRLGRYLGAVLDEVLARGVRRVCVAGGDTSGFVARELGVTAFEFVAPIAPGSPLCRMHAPGRPADGAEVCFKGGQVGKIDFMQLVRDGRKQM